MHVNGRNCDPPSSWLLDVHIGNTRVVEKDDGFRILNPLYATPCARKKHQGKSIWIPKDGTAQAYLVNTNHDGTIVKTKILFTKNFPKHPTREWCGQCKFDLNEHSLDVIPRALGAGKKKGKKRAKKTKKSSSSRSASSQKNEKVIIPPSLIESFYKTYPTLRLNDARKALIARSKVFVAERLEFLVAEKEHYHKLFTQEGSLEQRVSAITDFSLSVFESSLNSVFTPEERASFCDSFDPKNLNECITTPIITFVGLYAALKYALSTCEETSTLESFDLVTLTVNNLYHSYRKILAQRVHHPFWQRVFPKKEQREQKLDTLARQGPDGWQEMCELRELFRPHTTEFIDTCAQNFSTESPKMHKISSLKVTLGGITQIQLTDEEYHNISLYLQNDFFDFENPLLKQAVNVRRSIVNSDPYRTVQKHCQIGRSKLKPHQTASSDRTPAYLLLDLVAAEDFLQHITKLNHMKERLIALIRRNQKGEDAILTMQKSIRGHVEKKQFEETKTAAIVIQSALRSYLTAQRQKEIDEGMSAHHTLVKELRGKKKSNALPPKKEEPSGESFEFTNVQKEINTLNDNNFSILFQVFATPTPRLKYSDLKSLFGRLGGKIDEKAEGSRVRLLINDQGTCSIKPVSGFHAPHGRDYGEDMPFIVQRFKKALEHGGFTEENVQFIAKIRNII